MTGTDKAIRWSTGAAVIGVAVVAAVVSYAHAYALVHAHGETGWTAHLSCPAFSGLANLRLSYAVAFISRHSSMTSCGVLYPSAEWRRFRL
jgi:hypothetical protein